MADLALNDVLINEYLNYKFQDNYNSNIIRKLFKYIQPFAIRNDNIWLSDPGMAHQLETDPMIEIIDPCSDAILVQNTVLKFMITDTHISSSYKTLNLNNSLELLKPKYGATYINAANKINANEHIKFLLSDARWVKITDGYIATSRRWNDNKNILSNIIPLSSIDVKIVGADKNLRINSISQSKQNELKTLSSNLWNVGAISLPINVHDRYIETDKLKILLSSGLEHLSVTSPKDFTYIVEIK